MTLFEAVLKAIVAGVNAGAGAEEVVWVRDCGDRDLSRNSTIDCDCRQALAQWH